MAFRGKSSGRKPPPGDQISSLKIKLKGRDNAPLSIAELQEGFLEAARQLGQYQTGYRAKSAAIYLTLVDDDGEPVRINEANELTIYPYKTAAEEFGVD